MIIHRFMSEAEYDCLISGAKLMNATDHSRSGHKTDSVGFCFFIEDPEEAIHWLSGCTYPDLCVTMEVPDALLRESYGIYRDPKHDDLFAPVPEGGRPTLKHREYCTTQYSLSDGVRVLSSTDRYSKYAEIRREFERMGIL
ncbi:MAG: hypothetical protein IK144_11725 [Bacteroidaceae bacterium]|nr:hypothetical protein [Bacteroidaceae bacterium]